MTAPTLDSTAAAEHFFAGAVAAGMASVVISPGSRSTPLAIAADRTPGLSTSIHLDERSAAFVALGQAKASGCPVGLVCTSGTAAANYLPAIAEASMANVPLIAITADRPPEHQHIGVGQSFDQRGIYHRQVRAELSMPVGGDGGRRFTERAGWRAVATSLEHHGPVHVNWAFRLPLEPIAPPVDVGQPLQSVHRPEHLPATHYIEALWSLLDESETPIIIAGPETISRPRSKEAISPATHLLTTAETLGIPVMADTLSGLRGHPSPSMIHAPALVVEATPPEPDLIIRLGNTPTSKAARLWWESTSARQVIVDPFDDWQDPSQLATHRFRCDPTALLTAAAAGTPFDPSWLQAWSTAGEQTARSIADVLGHGPFTEAHVAAAIEAALHPSDLLVTSSSMPVRDLDMFTTINFGADVVANRGINGIDGVVATAMGVARSAPSRRTVVHIGDVAALHDVGAILDAARHDIPLTIVMPNNDGGGIFSFLPARQAIPASQFSELFHTPHGTRFDFLAAHPGITHQFVDDRETLVEALASPDDGVAILEVGVETSSRLALHDELLAAVRTR